MTERTTARVVGTLFIVASATAIIGGSLLNDIDGGEYLSTVAADEGTIVTGALLELVLVLSVVGIAALLFPILKREHEGLALSYLGARTIEAVLLLAAAMAAIVFLGVGKEVTGGMHEPIGDTLATGRELAYLIGSLVAFGVSAIILNWLLYRSTLVPSWLSVWGLIGGILILLRGIVETYGVDPSAAVQGVWAAPIAIQEMVFAVWLIVRGFGSPRVAVERRRVTV